MSIVIDYAVFVERLFAKRNTGSEGLMHAAVGCAGESGELLDAVKKTWVYEKPLDVENVIEELGDMEFYMQALRQQLGITREQTIRHNMAKLSARYPTGYSDELAQLRLDKQ